MRLARSGTGRWRSRRERCRSEGRKIAAARLSGRSNRRMPGWSEGICWAPEVSQAAVRVTVMACGPARSESSQRRAFPLEMSAPPMLQPDGSAAMQGSIAAEGTAWALRIIEWPVPQLGAAAPRFPTGKKACTPINKAAAVTASIAAARAIRRTLQRCSTIGGRWGARARNSPSRSRGSRFMKARSWVGLATPRVAANASASSAGVK